MEEELKERAEKAKRESRSNLTIDYIAHFIVEWDNIRKAAGRFRNLNKIYIVPNQEYAEKAKLREERKRVG